MINEHKLLEVIKLNNFTIDLLAEELGLTSKIFLIKLRRNTLGSCEINILIELLNIKNPQEIFFL